MVTTRNYRPALAVATLGAMTLAVVSTAAPALAANSIDVDGLGPVNVQVNYSCDNPTEVSAVKVMVGAPEADAPSAIGEQTDINCTGDQQTTVVTLNGAPLGPGQTVQVRAALVDRADTVISGTAKVVTLG
ncbi:hypothetical protein F3087_44110 [Nocardia colli]|uniref:Uncharacterized protein n=1 Tax=Nocardia colli TaxID=2545717 RepID=A0A5N0DL65_9NOCA|nr:hypothetical protein [Nocardia colli]KAA8877483.1 hypothetical protein F3087_44110 [Nocardia colli]